MTVFDENPKDIQEAIFALCFVLGQCLMAFWSKSERFYYPKQLQMVYMFTCENPGMYEFCHLLCSDPWFWFILYTMLARSVLPVKKPKKKPENTNSEMDDSQPVCSATRSKVKL